MIYTTNAIERLHRGLLKIVKTRGTFPSDEAAMKPLYLALRYLGVHWKPASNGEPPTRSSPSSSPTACRLLSHDDQPSMDRGVGPCLNTPKPASWSNSDLKAAIPAKRAALGSARLFSCRRGLLSHLIRACAPGDFSLLPPSAKVARRSPY
jgi:hypothetical protein